MAMAACSTFACRHPTCHLTFDTHASMLQHYLDFSHAAGGTTHTIQHEHTAEKTADEADHVDPPEFYPCDLCPRYFKSASALCDHLRAFHLTTPDLLPPVPIAPASLLPHQLPIPDVACNDCGGTFKTTDALHQHQWATPYHTHVAASRNPNLGTRARICSQCHTKLPSPEDLDQHFVEQHPLSEVSKQEHDEGTWHTVEGRFRVAWTKPTIQLYNVHRIFKVYNPGWRRKDFEDYRKELKRQMSEPKMVKKDIPHELRNKIRSDGNELYRYHGTTVKCKLGRPAEKVVDGAEGQEALSLCSDTECSLCRILETGFTKEKCRINSFQRYGKGIYCSGSSSKASAYVKCNVLVEKQQNFNCFSICCGCLGSSDHSSSEVNQYKVMMVCRVLAGRPYHTTRNLQHLKGPPDGFHSVQGDPGEKLNYDELVIYNDCAILPAYIILYTSSD
ncbi:hypothetical protein GOP47_0021272 [Adiantum capillus-veneris]|uniref:C2H2-type domain-containing protein n=1 Tax=Adiantum capillus-veneris TaxID=13818 RepID=A0A9D4UBK5_ADICA|nr:hypothetical protein GOP47_0021272 [Adiantum capillus-veneris]